MSNYKSAAVARRRGRKEQRRDGSSIGRDVTNETGHERQGRPEGKALTRFEMLYQDVSLTCSRGCFGFYCKTMSSYYMVSRITRAHEVDT